MQSPDIERKGAESRKTIETERMQSEKMRFRKHHDSTPINYEAKQMQKNMKVFTTYKKASVEVVPSKYAI